MVAYSFNSQQYQPQYGGGGGLPAGKYKGVIVDSQQQPTQDNQGGYLALVLTPIDGPLAGQKHTDRLNLHNKNQQTVEIANKQLSAYCHVLGKYQFQDTAELHNIPFMFEIAAQKNNPQYTEVVAIYDINGNEPGKAGGGAMAQSQPAPSGPPPAGVQPSQPAPGGWGGQAPQGQPPAQGQPQGGGQWGGPPQGGQQQAPAQGGWGAPPAGVGPVESGPPMGGQPPAQGGWGGQPAPDAGQGQAPGQWGGQQQGGGAPAAWGPR